MEVTKSRRDKKSQRVKGLELKDPMTNHYRHVESKVRERAEMIIDEIENELDPEKIISIVRNITQGSLGFDENWKRRTSWDQNVTLARLKIELEKRTSGHGTNLDKKNSLKYRLLHEVRDMDAERRLLKMFNSKKHKESGSPLKELEEQGKLREFNWDLTLSRNEIQKQIQVLEKRHEEDIKVILDRRKKLESMKREMTRARPCSRVVWGMCKHPQIREFDPFIWGLCGCTCEKPLSKKNREMVISTMRMQFLRDKLGSIREQRRKAFRNLLYQMDDSDYGLPEYQITNKSRGDE